MAAGEASIEALLQDLGNKGLRKAPQPRYAIEGGTSKSRRTFYRPTNWGGVGWGVIAFVTTARHDGRLRYAFVTTARHDGRLRYAFVSTARHDVMLRYAFVTTAARHDLMLRYAFCHYCKTWWEATLRMGWGRVGCGGVGWGVGCDSIRHYCKTWCDATLRIRLYCKTWCDATLRIRLYCKTWWEATLRYWKLMKKSIPDSIRFQVQGKRNGLLFKYIRSHQWRWEHTGFDLLTATGEAVRSLMRWREKATLIVRRVLKHKTL